MASTAPRMSTGIDGLRHQPLRQALMSLTIDPEVPKCQHRIRKPAQRIQQRMRNVRRNTTQARRELLQLGPDQRDHAVAIFKKLAEFEHFANRAPTLRGLVSGGIELEYPRYRLWRLLADPSMPPLRRADVQLLRETVIGYTISLHDAHIPYAPDLTTLEVMSKRLNRPMARPIYRPFINTFDFDVDPNDQTILWAERRETKIQRVKAQFAVLEWLAELSNPHSSEAQRLSLDLEPSVVARVLREHRPPLKRNLVIRHVKTYSTELGQFVLDFTGQYLRSLSCRNSLPMSSTKQGCLDYCATVSHVLHVMDNFIQDRRSGSGSVLSQHTDSVISDRVALLIMRAALLIHCYAKTATVIASHGLLEASRKDTVDSYTTSEHFTSVTQACHAAEKEVHELAEKGYQLDREFMYFVRVDG